MSDAIKKLQDLETLGHVRRVMAYLSDHACDDSEEPYQLLRKVEAALVAADQERVQKAFQDCQAAVNAETHGGAVYADDAPPPAPTAGFLTEQEREAIEVAIEALDDLPSTVASETDDIVRRHTLDMLLKRDRGECPIGNAAHETGGPCFACPPKSEPAPAQAVPDECADCGCPRAKHTVGGPGGLCEDRPKCSCLGWVPPMAPEKRAARTKAWLDSLPDGSDLPPNICLVCGYSWPGNTPPPAPCSSFGSRGYHITSNAPAHSASDCQLRPLLREAGEAVATLRALLKDTPCSLEKRIERALAQPCAPADAGEWELIHECVPFEQCRGVFLAIPNHVEGDEVRVLKRRRAPQQGGGGR